MLEILPKRKLEAERQKFEHSQQPNPKFAVYHAFSLPLAYISLQILPARPAGRIARRMFRMAKDAFQIRIVSGLEVR